MKENFNIAQNLINFLTKIDLELWVKPVDMRDFN